MDVVQPRLSWQLQSGQRGEKQTACQILVSSTEAKLQANQGDLWDSGRMDSGQSIQVVYQGRPLTSWMKAWWKVRV